MSLDPFIQALFDRMPQLAHYPLWDKTPAEARAAFKFVTQFSAPQSVPIGKSADLQAPGPAGPVTLRVYTPVAAGAGPLPGLVYFHGGGFVLGDLESYDPLCRTLANESGCRVVSVEYRLAPENKFPAAIDDAFAALTWIESNPGELGIDPNRLAVGGDSAGGNLAAVMCQRARNSGGPTIDFQLLIYPATVMGVPRERSSANDLIEDARNLRWFQEQYLPEGADVSDPRISPLLAPDFKDLPPAYIVTAGYDLLRSDGVAYAEKLKAEGIAVTHIDYPTMIHGFFLMQNWIPAASDAVSAAAHAVRSAFD